MVDYFLIERVVYKFLVLVFKVLSRIYLI